MGSLVLTVGGGKRTELKDYLYYKDTSSSAVKSSTDLSAVQNSIYNMFLFTQGERILNPEYGNTLYKYLYEPINTITAEKLGNEIYTMFKTYEPRIDIKKIKVTPYPDDNEYQVIILYTVPLLNSAVQTFSTSVSARR